MSVAKKSPPKKRAKVAVKRGQTTPEAKAKTQAQAKTQSDLPVQTFASAGAFERWLRTHHESSPGLWLRLMKKSSPEPGVSYAEALDIALSYGWIDGQTKTHDAHSWLRKFVPRGPRSIWSKINREKAQALIENKRMQPAGLAQVERAKADGRWQDAYDSASKAQPSAEFAAALAASPRAAVFFAQLNGANRYSVLFREKAAKKPETRARKIRELIAMLERGEKIHA
ncbi:MAG TPA: YdeI/OmpD-associated family protein [Polyangiaceae bacterium]|nr:YdeI/OmpD-associated family protein [Polyangiaceae bacterium]